MNSTLNSTLSLSAVALAVAAADPSGQSVGVDPQASDVGTTGAQIPEAELGMRIEGGDALSGPMSATLADMPVSIIGVDLASGPDVAWPPVITPTVGRKVWFFPNGCQFHSTPKCIDESQAMDADVVYVWGDRMVNLCVKDHIGQVHAFNSVPLVQPGDGVPIAGEAYATWMPYQVATSRAA